MIRIRCFGVQWEWEFSFFAVLGLLFALEEGQGIRDSLAAIALHECGHLVMMHLLGQRVRQITFRGCGIQIVPAHAVYSYGQDVLVLLSGPLMNLLCCLILWIHGGTAVITESFCFSAHLVLGILNLLPCRSLDGGAILRCMVGLCGGDVQGMEWYLRLIACCMLVLLGIMGFLCGIRNVSAYAVLVYLFCTEML